MLFKKNTVKRKHDVNMTEGNIAKCLIKFAIPLFIGNLFQQLYNIVDTWVIGRWGLDAEYAAVGNIGPVINILIGLFMGFSSGAGVVISQYYGAKDEKKVHDAVHIAMLLTFVCAVLFSIIGVLAAPLILHAMLGAESEIFPAAKTYLTIYFAGVAGLLIYNMGSAILRAVGDSKRPFYFLAASALTNIALDLLFVIQFKMGVAGIALATIIAQFISATLTLITLLRTNSCVKLRLRDMKLDFSMLGRIVHIGLPTAFQLAITSFSNVFVQSYIGGIDPIIHQTAHLGAWTTYSKIDQFIFLPVQSLSLAAMTFVGQNLGKGDIPRAKKGTFTSYGIATVCTVFIIVPIMIFAPTLAGFFNDTPLVVEYATTLLRLLSPFYVLCCINQIFSGALRGAGNTTMPMVNMLVSFVAFRQLYLFTMSNFISNDLVPIAMSYPAGWLICSTLTLITYFTFQFENSKKLIQ